LVAPQLVYHQAILLLASVTGELVLLRLVLAIQLQLHSAFLWARILLSELLLQEQLALLVWAQALALALETSQAEPLLHLKYILWRNAGAPPLII
jgi:hypothetical protein